MTAASRKSRPLAPTREAADQFTCCNQSIRPLSEAQPQGPAKIVRFVSGRQWASRRLASVYRLAGWRHTGTGTLVDPQTVDAWLTVLADALASASEGPVAPASPGQQRRPARFPGLDFGTLTEAARRCLLQPTEQALETALSRAVKYRVDHPKHRMMGGGTAAKLLSVTAYERRAARAWSIGAVDQTPNEVADAGRELKNATRKARRRAQGMIARTHYEGNSLTKTAPWQAQGISRRTWERHRAKALEENAAAGGDAVTPAMSQVRHRPYVETISRSQTCDIATAEPSDFSKSMGAPRLAGIEAAAPAINASKAELVPYRAPPPETIGWFAEQILLRIKTKGAVNHD